MDEKEIKRELGEEQAPSDNRKIEQKVTDFIKLALKRAAEWDTKFGKSISRSKEEKRVVILGEHWPEKLKTARENLGLPCLTLNHGIVHRDGVAGELLQNMPAAKYRGFDSNTDPKMAEIGTSLLRRIEANSNVEDIDAETVKMALTSGYPAWQVVYHDYANAKTFNQEIFIRFFPHQYSAMLDPNMTAYDTPDRGGPKWGMIVEDMPKPDFERKYKGAQTASIDGLPSEELNWWSKDTVRVASYYVAEPKQVKLLLLEGNQVVEKDSDEHKQMEAAATAAGSALQVKRERETTVYEIKHYRISGREILPNDEGKREGQKVAGEYIPIIPWEGKFDYLDTGEKHYRGVFSNAIDANKMLSYHATMAAERAATGRQFKGTPTHTKGFVDQWGNPIGHGMLHFNHDPQEPGGPKEINTVTELNQSVQMMQYGSQEVQDLTNWHEANLGAKSNETSGRAIDARRQQGNTSNYEFPLNFARAIRYRTKIIESMIPEVYDYETTIRILGDDGKEKRTETINQRAPGGVDEYLNDTSKARFDTVVTTGPSYKTQRMEAAAIMEGVARSSPDANLALMPFMLKANDAPLDDEAIKRLDFILEKTHPGITQATKGDGDEGKIRAAVQAAIEQFEAKVMPGIEHSAETIKQMGEALERERQENAQLKQQRDDATRLMEQKAAEFELKQREQDLKLREHKLEMREKAAVKPEGDGEVKGPVMQEMQDLQAQVAQLTQIVERLVPQGGAAA